MAATSKVVDETPSMPSGWDRGDPSEPWPESTADTVSTEPSPEEASPEESLASLPALDVSDPLVSPAAGGCRSDQPVQEPSTAPEPRAEPTTPASAAAEESADGSSSSATPSRRQAKDSDRPVDEPMAAFAGLIDIVVNERDKGRLEFWHAVPGPSGSFQSRVPTGRVAENGRPVVWVPPPADQLPWTLPRRAQVARFLNEDTNAGYFDAVLAWIKENVDLPSDAAYVLHAAWIAHTYLIDQISHSPYLLEQGPPESGKTRLLGTCIHVAYRGILTPTAREAALIRYADDLRATVALDTVDFATQVRSMQDFLAARTKNDGTVTTRVFDHRKGRFKGIQHYRAFGATLVASNTPPEEDWLASRTLIVQARQSSRSFPDPIDRSAARVLRERGVAFRGRILIGLAKHPLPTPARLAPGRLGDLLSGLALAVQLTRPEYLAHLQSLTEPFAAARKAEVRDTPEVEVLRSCIEHAARGGQPEVKVQLKTLVQAVNLERTDNGERKLSSQKVGDILRTTFGIQTWPGTGNYTFVTLERKRLTELAARYGLEGPDSARTS